MLNADSLVRCQAEIDGKWVVARPLKYFTYIGRLKDTWAVLTGKAEAVKFYKQ